MNTIPVFSDPGVSSRYAIIEVLCEGSDTLLYRGVRQGDRRPVVLKVLRRDHASPRAFERLRHEHEVARAIDSTAIVKPYALEMLGDLPALVLEDFGGVSLDRLLDGPTPLERFFPLAVRLAEALAGLHRHGVVHKDIKPQNVLLHPATGEVKITDLGIASQIPRELQHLAHVGLIEGTLAYMAPEQTGRMNRWIDERTDLYSLGVVFYEMLTGTLPFRASDPVAWVYCHIAQKPVPPHALVPSIPPLLSEVVLKLLSKAAEERYQSAAGLRHDLDECFARWRESGAIPPFALGQRDLSDRFQVPQRLYGREREVEALLAVFERVVAQGRPELVLVSGYAGIGKSSLVAELHRPIVRERGFFLSGKFDQTARDVPYRAFLQAFRALLQEILGASEEQVERWRQRFREALGESGRLLADVLPELGLLLGPQPPVPELPPTEAQSRLHATLQRFVSACAQKEHPVALFLDDLQWADAGSLQLLEQLATYAGSEHLLLIGAYRDNEVGPAHPLRLTLAEARKRGAAVSELVLAPLSAAHVGALVAETVHAPHAPAEQVEPLSRLVYEKTGGNPFFVLQFLIALHQEGLIAFDAEEGRWRWDIAAIRDKGFTDNVVDLMAGKLMRLSAPTREALTLAACLGSSLDLDTLAVVAGRPAAELRDALEEAVREGLLLRRGSAYRFLHDRVQQAAYSLIPAGQLAEMHLGIGRLLLRAQRAEARDEALFDIVGHLNRGAAFLRSQAERDEVAALNLRAGRKAKAAAAFESAAALFAAGLSLLAPASWETQHELTYDLTLERAHVAYITGGFDEAERLLEELMERAKTRRETAAAVELVLAFYLTRGHYARAVEIGLSWLRACGIDLPLHPAGAQIEEETKSVWQVLGDRAIEDLIHLPPMTDPEIEITMGVLQRMVLPAVFVDPDLHYLVVLRMVQLSLRHGNAEPSALAYAAFARLIGPRFGRYEEGYLFGKLGCDLADRSGLLTTKSAVFSYLGQTVVFWTRHYREAYPYARAGFSAAVESGDLNNACFGCLWVTVFRLLCGEPLEDVLREVEERLGFVRRAGYAFAHIALLSGHAMIQTLRGRPVRFSMPDGSELDPPAFEAQLEEEDLRGVRALHYSLKAQALFVLGSPREALAAATRAIAEHPPRVGPHALIVESFYVRALSLAALSYEAHEAQPSPQRALPEELLECERQLGEWARSGPDNFLHKHALVRAEIARLRGQDLEAIGLYEQAISSAREGGFVQHEAIASELAAELYRARGLSTSEDAHLRKARAAYFTWGAHAKVEQLDQRYPHLVERKPIAPTVTFAVRAEQFDVLSVVKASQGISGELKLPPLLETLLRVVVEHAGAEEGCVLLVRDERLWTAAIETPGGAVRLLGADEAPSAALPRSVLNYVRRSHERVLLDDAAARHPFMEDEYFRRKRPRSVLCLPIVRQARLIGLLYLENNLVTGAFTAGRLSVIELLASQSAISLENAMLYAELEQENAERRRAEQALKANQEMLQAIVDNSAAGVYVKDCEGRYLLANRPVAALLGVPSEQILGKTDAELFPPPVAAALREHDRQVLEAGAPMEWEETVPLASGLRTALSVKFPLGQGAEPRAVCGISTDITERKRAEQAERFLAEASRRLMTLGYGATFESVAQLPVPELSDQCVVEVLLEDRTPGPTAVAGVPREQLGALKDALRALAEASPASSEGKDGRATPLLQQVHSLDPRVRPPWDRLGVRSFLRVPLLARDRYFGVMTLLATAPERRYGPADLQLAEELGRRAALVLDNARLYAEAQEAIQRRDEFLVVASHELKTPLTSLQMQVQAVERALRRRSLADVPPERFERMFQTLGRQTLRLGRLIDELLDVTRLNAGRLTLARAPVDLTALAREVVDRMRPQLADARCPIQLDLDEPVVGHWDPSRVEQVVINLLSNAMKYGAERPILVGVRRKADRALVVVRDQGIGIAEADQGRIFERFERAVSVRNFGGLGLGLYIVRSIVMSHGGSIRVESHPGAGATFVVELPLNPPEADEPG
ncbi:AAA family ATPase [Sorangium cellulosum]|uniref:histidine kinase n=1 Tax=Sorangium cellulosum So0157-2 TaxID=1254432 RepID=S4XNQ7_SORCE|nr:AAA family ATPase [Sorangium cellulosum]AGP34817.1 protein kinase [Sorangium cellulosum So0157-2]